MKKWIIIFGTVLLILFNSAMPVCAQQEADTAGVSLGKNISDTVYKKNRSNTQGWMKDNTGWWYQYSDGSYPVSAWRKIDGNWYYFDSNGYWVDDNTCEKGTLKGIDVSHWQGDINWSAVKNDGIEFALIRVGRSERVLDEQYKKNISGATSVGIPAGVYYYSKAQSINEAILDAQFVIKNITGYKISYPVVIDIEDSSQTKLNRTQLGAIAKAFCDEIRAAGYTPMIYTNENWYKNYIDMNQLSNVKKWIARYNYFCSADIPRDIWQCTSNGKVSGISGNVDINFSYTDFSKIITPRMGPVSGYVPKEGRWVLNDVGWWYSYYNGGYPKNTWKQIDGKEYWFDSNGYMKTGWLYNIGNWYYLDSNGLKVIGWKKINSEWYYFDSKGIMLSNQWVGDYFLKSDGTMAVSQWVDGGQYYVGADGKWIPNKTKYVAGWKKDHVGWWYQNADGTYPQKTWKQINGKWYYFNVNGYMHTGWLQLGSKWYYMNSNGEMVTGSVNINGNTYSFNNNGEWLGY